ncbi:hypothetical protein DM860_017614 [Cuscuta australis]|uniref:Uncharacterized protein n=1 Tax=Cuscuta australis TaxID=267555 RepID=A0A328E9P0_9ASTE|nr:hypothetical protein DM860_017614 [Cuscuta australis]
MKPISPTYQIRFFGQRIGEASPIGISTSFTIFIFIQYQWRKNIEISAGDSEGMLTAVRTQWRKNSTLWLCMLAIDSDEKDGSKTTSYSIFGINTNMERDAAFFKKIALLLTTDLRCFNIDVVAAVLFDRSVPQGSSGSRVSSVRWSLCPLSLATDWRKATLMLEETQG